MPVRRSIEIDGQALDAYAAVKRLLAKQITEGAFKQMEDDPGQQWGIAWYGPLASSRYLFEFSPGSEGGTHVDAALWLGGLIGPVHQILRRGGNRRHLDRLLADLKTSVEDPDSDLTAGSNADAADLNEIDDDEEWEGDADDWEDVDEGDDEAHEDHASPPR